MNTKEQVVASIEAAKADMEQALRNLQQLPALDWNAVRYTMHTMGNYLNITAACVGLLRLATTDSTDPDIDMALESLERTTDLMAHLTRHLMHNSAAREVPLLSEEVDLARMARRACSFYQGTAEHKRIAIVCEAPETALVRADRIAAATVFDNLLSNAVKFSPANKRIQVQVKIEPGFAVCAVQDEGPGLSTDDQARLFRPGERLGPVPTGGEPSTGYGLAICRDLVVRMGGRIWCESQLGQGTTFSFGLPAFVVE